MKKVIQMVSIADTKLLVIVLHQKCLFRLWLSRYIQSLNCQPASREHSSQCRIFGRGGALRAFSGDPFSDHKCWEYDIGHLMRAVRAHKSVTTTKDALWSEHCEAMADYFEPGTLKARMLSKKMKGEFHDPQQMTILRYRVRFDVAAMMIRRKLFDEQAHFFFYNYDSSPQHGLEIFGGSEDFIPVMKVWNKTFDQINPKDFGSIKLSITTLSQGRYSTMDKTACLTHQRWCHHGPQIWKVQQHACYARGGLSDQGKSDMEVADFWDITEAVMTRQRVADDTLKKVQ